MSRVEITCRRSPIAERSRYSVAPYVRSIPTRMGLLLSPPAFLSQGGKHKRDWSENYMRSHTTPNGSVVYVAESLKTQYVSSPTLYRADSRIVHRYFLKVIVRILRRSRLRRVSRLSAVLADSVGGFLSFQGTDTFGHSWVDPPAVANAEVKFDACIGWRSTKYAWSSD